VSDLAFVCKGANIIIKQVSQFIESKIVNIGINVPPTRRPESYYNLNQKSTLINIKSCGMPVCVFCLLSSTY